MTKLFLKYTLKKRCKMFFFEEPTPWIVRKYSDIDGMFWEFSHKIVGKSYCVGRMGERSYVRYMGWGKVKSQAVMIHKRDELWRCHNAWNWFLIETENQQKIKKVKISYGRSRQYSNTISPALPNSKALTFQRQIHTNVTMQACYELILQYLTASLDRQYSNTSITHL